MNAKAQAHLSSTSMSTISDPIYSEKKKGFELTITLPQLVFSWVLIALMMMAVFVFGLYAGRRQGVDIALEEQATPKLRMPVSKDAALAAVNSESEKRNNSETSPLGEREDSLFAVPETVDNLPKSSSELGPLADGTAGFVSKATNEILDSTSKASTKSKTTKLEAKSDLAQIKISKDLVAAEERAVQKLSEKPLEKTVVLNNKIAKPSGQELRSADSVTKKLNDDEFDVLDDESSILPPTASLDKQIGSNENFGLTENSNQTAPIKTSENKLAKKNLSSKLQKGGLYVQVSAPDSITQAQSLVNKLKAKGLTSAIRDAKVGGKLHYRVLVGPYSSKEAASEARNKVVKSKIVRAEPFIKTF